MIGYYSALLFCGLGLIFPAFAETDQWSGVERELVHYLTLQQDSHLARWQQVISHLPDKNSDEKIKLLAAGKSEILRLLQNSAIDKNWKSRVVRHLEEFLKRGRANEIVLTEAESAELMSHLKSAHPDPRNLTPLEWKMLDVFYGRKIATAFLFEAFAPERLNQQRAPASIDSFQGNNAEIVYIEDSHQWNASGTELQMMFKKSPAPDILKKDIVNLKNVGLKVHTVTLPSFPSFEDQAHELQHSFEVLRETTQAPLILISSGIASAVVYRWLDLHPENRDRDDIRAWINWNGRLYGADTDENAEDALKSAEHSLKKSRSPAAETEWEMAAANLSPQKDMLNPPMPLGPGFPIFNFVPLAKENVPPENFREAIVPEGKILVAHEPWAGSDLPNLIQRALNP